MWGRYSGLTAFDRRSCLERVHPADFSEKSYVNRRHFLQRTVHGVGCALLAKHIVAGGEATKIGNSGERFPFFKSTPVSYINVKMKDTFWAPRQKAIRDVSIPWATRHFDKAGGLDAFNACPHEYDAQIRPGDFEVIKFVEAMAAAIGLQRDASIEGLTAAWGRKFVEGQDLDGYWTFGWPLAADPTKRWQTVWWSHEDYALGHYLESALAYYEITGDRVMYESALRAVDNMAATFIGSNRAYVPGHAEIEQALMRLYSATGEARYLQLCGWLIGQRGRHEGRQSFGKYAQDHIPIKDQRTIEGHAVRAAFLFNGVTEYVGATGDDDYRQAVLAVWDDFVDNKMYLHGGGGVEEARNEGFSSKPNFIPPEECYGESCSVFGNFQWAHNLFRLTGDAKYIDVAERMLYNAFYASLSLRGDRYFYQNAVETTQPILRLAWNKVPCCPPNIVKLFCKVGGFFFATDQEGIFVKHYGASEADIPFDAGVKLTQVGNYPWDGELSFHIEPKRPVEFTLRLRVPSWAKSQSLSVNGTRLRVDVHQGWVAVRRRWEAGDRVDLSLPMTIERITMPSRFKEYAGLEALQRGPIVYCLEEPDVTVPVTYLRIPAETAITAEHRVEFLGGVTVLRGMLQVPWDKDGSPTIPAVFIPYGVWNNRGASEMRIWLYGQNYQHRLSEKPPGSDEV